MQWITTTELAGKLGLSDRTVRDWCMKEPELAHKTGGIWQVNVRTLAELRGIDLVDLLLLLQSPDTKLIKATKLAKDACFPRRTIAHWCATRPGFAVRVGTVWFVNLAKLGVTEEELRNRRREQTDDEDQ